MMARADQVLEQLAQLDPIAADLVAGLFLLLGVCAAPPGFPIPSTGIDHHAASETNDRSP